METIYADIAARTQGNIYIGVVGPVRTGKSTLVKRIMEMLVIPNVSDPYRRERARDELPQCGSGKTIMTSEPKFVPEEAVEISPDGTTKLKLRLIDSVGYMVDGAVGATEDGQERMVTTPWFDREIPMSQAAELGTQKVMQEHCSVGLVVTTDGTATDIPRNDYLSAEARAIRDMQSTGKPFLVIINSRAPEAEAARQAQAHIQAQFGLQSVIADCQNLDNSGIAQLLQQLLLAFPMTQLQIYMPRWMDAVEDTHPVKEALYRALAIQAQQIRCLGQAEEALQPLSQVEGVQSLRIRKLCPATGNVECVIRFPESLFYEILSARAQMPIENDAQLLQLLTQLSKVKQKYDRIADALNCANATGYGVVMPSADQMTLDDPEVVRKNGAFGVRLKAAAPSIHMIRVDVDTQISPMVGDEKQSKELVDYLMTQSPEQLWQSNIFGKSVYTLIQEGLNAKLIQLPAEVRDRFRGTLSRVINEGASGLICLIL